MDEEEDEVEYELTALDKLKLAYIRVRTWLQPYYRHYEGGAGSEEVRKARQRQAQKREAAKLLASGRQAQIIEAVDVTKRMSEPSEMTNLPDLNSMWCYHDESVHQIFGHFAPKSGYTHKVRDGVARKKLKPLIYPIDVGVFDRTHLIPIGFHGSESDNRLLVGWDSATNQGPFNSFEKRQKSRDIPIYWWTQIERTPTGALWSYKIYNAQTDELIDSLEHEMRATFIWK